MDDLSIYGIALTPVILGLVYVIQKLGVPNRILPAVSLAIGIGIGLVYYGTEDWRKGLILGIWLGLAAIGIHSGVKNTVGNNGN